MNAAPCAERRGTSSAGFTLVELLVSMVVVSMVVLTVMGGLRFVVRAFAHTDARRAGLEELTLGLAVLRGELQRVQPLMHKVRDEERVLFEGGPDRLRFANVEPPFLAGPPYTIHEYAIETSGTRYRVELRRAPLDPAEPTLDRVGDGDPRTLLEMQQPLRFSYFGARREREPARWHEAWPAGERLPQAVRLAVGDEPGWPEVTVPLRMPKPWYCATSEPVSSAGCGEAAGEDRARRDNLGERDRRREERDRERPSAR